MHKVLLPEAVFRRRMSEMKMTHMTQVLAAVVSIGFAIPNALAAADSQAALMAEAKVSESQARTTALAKVPLGVVKSSELEKEHGRLVWSFDIAAPPAKGVTEILIDAKTGKIISVKKESPAEEAKEAKADAAAAR